MCRIVSRPESAPVCPTFGLSTRDEPLDAARCLAEVEGSRILIVTSDFHIGRALSIFCNELHGKTFSIALHMMSGSLEPGGGRTGSGPRPVPTMTEASVVKRCCPMASSRITRHGGKCNR